MKLQSREHVIYTLSAAKTSLSVFDNKRFWLNDNQSSLPLGHFEIANYLPAKQKQTTITDYFGPCAPATTAASTAGSAAGSGAGSGSESDSSRGSSNSSTSSSSSGSSSTISKQRQKTGQLAKWWRRVPAPAAPFPPTESSASSDGKLPPAHYHYFFSLFFTCCSLI